MDKSKKIVAVILAAGKGERFKGQKQFFTLNGKMLWQHVYDKVVNLFDKERIVTVGVDIEGGKTRSQSVINGLKYFYNQQPDRVIILEAARPLVTKQQIEILIEENYPSVSFVMPLVNTVVWREGTYIDRNNLYELLTPQTFSYKMLLEAYESNKFYDMTDETRVMFEYYGIKPKFIETTPNLLKVTYQRDIPIIKEIMENFKF